MTNNYKTTSLRGPSSVSQIGGGERIESADKQRWAISRNQKRSLPDHRFDIVKCWTLKQRINGKCVTIAIQQTEERAIEFIS